MPHILKKYYLGSSYILLLVKNTLINFYQKKIVFFLLASLLVVGLSLMFFFEKEALHLTINKYHNFFFDLFFKYTTYLGDGIVFPIVIVGLIIFKRQYAAAFIFSGILTLIISYAFKHWVFIGYARPYEVFGDSLHLIEGVKMRKWYSFPSGHTTSAFALFFLAILYAKKMKWQLLFISLAIIASLSRVYLSQHFLQDIVGGAILGTSIALVSHHLAQRYPLFKK
jgi:membrane-associated phospholipid phosphatase